MDHVTPVTFRNQWRAGSYLQTVAPRRFPFPHWSQERSRSESLSLVSDEETRSRNPRDQPSLIAPREDFQARNDKIAVNSFDLPLLRLYSQSNIEKSTLTKCLKYTHVCASSNILRKMQKSPSLETIRDAKSYSCLCVRLAIAAVWAVPELFCHK